MLLADVTLHCGMYPADKVDISQHLAILRFPRVTILSASPVRTLVHCVVEHSRPPDPSFPPPTQRARINASNSVPKQVV